MGMPFFSETTISSKLNGGAPINHPFDIGIDPPWIGKPHMGDFPLTYPLLSGNLT